MNSWVFFQDSILSGLNKSERRNNVDFLKCYYLVELYKTKIQMFILNISLQITIYVKPKVLQQTLENDHFFSISS